VAGSKYPSASRRFAATFPVAFLLLSACNGIFESLADDTSEFAPRTASMAPGLPPQWFGSAPTQFEVGLDSDVRRGGRASAYIRTRTRLVFGDQFGVLTQTMRADAYRGSRVRFSAWLRTSRTTGEGVGLWFRSDGVGPQPFENMDGRRLTGTEDWREVSIVADIPDDAIGFAFGVISVSPGITWADDLRFEIVDSSVATTAPLRQGAQTDTALISQQYDRASLAPRNLDFEGVFFPAANPETVTWVKNASFAFATDDPVVPATDLDPLRNMVGNASIVALGEATHGTREFFRMKHRMLEWLVRNMGFSYFGIEATLPEAVNVDHYVQTGEGNPARLLSQLRFWTWNTREVLDMIEWMRSWNAAGNMPKVHFVGFDMQFAGVAIDSVTSFVSYMDQQAGATVKAAYTCIDQFRDPPGSYNPSSTRYGAQTPVFKDACRASIRSVDTLLAQREAEWTASEGREKVLLVRRMARVINQWEELFNGTPSTVNVRDRSMAENVAWWHDTYAPGAKMVLWAHNLHISRVRNWMGEHLGRKYGSRYLNVAQTFGTGEFNAIRLIPADTSLGPSTIATFRDESIESVFLGAAMPRLIFDARRVRTATTPAAEPLFLPLSIRSIGASYNPVFPIWAYQVPLLLKNDYDLIVWFETARASALLPFLP
jgi:erythromycin esterase